MASTIRLAFSIVLVLAILFGGYVLWDTLSNRPKGGESVIATEAPALRGAPTETVAIKAPVKVFKGKTKERLKLPTTVQKDEKKQVIAATQAPASLRPTTTSTVVDIETGAVETYTKQDPYPWLAIETRGEIKLAHGYKWKSSMPVAERVTRLQVNYDVLRVKALTIGATGTLDTDRDAFIGVGVSYKW